MIMEFPRIERSAMVPFVVGLEVLITVITVDSLEHFVSLPRPVSPRIMKRMPVRALGLARSEDIASLHV